MIIENKLNKEIAEDLKKLNFMYTKIRDNIRTAIPKAASEIKFAVDELQRKQDEIWKDFNFTNKY